MKENSRWMTDRGGKLSETDGEGHRREVDGERREKEKDKVTEIEDKKWRQYGGLKITNDKAR